MARADRELFERMVDALNAVHGRHEGRRAVHVHGTCARGEFTATPDAARLTRAPHMQGAPVPVTVRFSNGTGDPSAPDRRRDGRGIAVKFHLPNGKETDMVGISLPVFFVRTPEDFLELQAALTPDPATGAPDPQRVMPFVQAHPESLPALQYVMQLQPAESYARQIYRGLHAFRYVGADGGARFVRYRWEPEAGEASIPEDAARALPDRYLRAELFARLGDGPVAFRLRVQIARDEDPTTDPTAAWPSDREDVEIGRLVLREPVDDCDAMLFDPMMLVDGIEASDDPILRARSGAYGVSFKRRRAPVA
jgi:catalase